MRQRITPRAVLFDFNGVLVDDERIHWRALRDVLRRGGLRLTWRAYVRRYLALDDRAACRAILRDAGRGAAGGAVVARLVAAKRRRFLTLARARGLAIGPGAAALVRAVARRAPVAIVSGAARAEITALLRAARLATDVATVVSSDDVRRSKPDPEGYRRALLRLGAAARRSVAVEDSPGGIAAARAAGLRVVGVATTYAPATLRRAGACSVARSLARPRALLGLLGFAPDGAGPRAGGRAGSAGGRGQAAVARRGSGRPRRAGLQRLP